MKHYKITLGKNPDGSLRYPSNYQSEIGNYCLDHLYYDVAGTSYLLVCLPDEIRDVVRTNVEELTEAEAKALSETHEERTEKVKDEVKLRRIELKVALKQELTAEEAKCIDKDDEASIFEDSKILADRIDKIKSEIESQSL
jgi:hypothetical protein